MGNILKGKVATVTGSGRGIGRANIIAMAEQGAKVVVNDPGVATDGTATKERPADEVVATIKKAGGTAVANYDSISTSAGAANLVKTAIDNFGRLDILVNNAGIARGHMVWNMTDEEWDTVLKVHLYGHFYCSREAIRVFRQQGGSGRIINTSSRAGLGGTGQINYVAAKEGIVGLTRGLAHEVGKYGITVNCIRPGGATRLNVSPATLEASMKRLGISREEAERRQAETLAKNPPVGNGPLIVFLASDAADNVNGCIFDAGHGGFGIYTDPPDIDESAWLDGDWTAEELVQLLPRTLTNKKVREIPPYSVRGDLRAGG